MAVAKKIQNVQASQSEVPAPSTDFKRQMLFGMVVLIIATIALVAVNVSLNKEIRGVKHRLDEVEDTNSSLDYEVRDIDSRLGDVEDSSESQQRCMNGIVDLINRYERDLFGC